MYYYYFMFKKHNLPKVIPVFPIKNFIIFPKATVPLNIFEPRYIDMINDSMSSNKLIGMIQPKDNYNYNNEPNLYSVGCLGKIVNLTETSDGRYLIELNGILRFETMNEINNNKKYREFSINFENYFEDLTDKKEDLKFSDLELIFKDLKSLFEKKGYLINWKGLENQSLDETINALAIASPFSLEEKQVLLEAKDLNSRKNRISEILSTYSHDIFNNTTIQ